MATRMCYLPQRLKDAEGRDTSFFRDMKGRVYEDKDGFARRVGKMNKKGGVTVTAKYIEKFEDRLREIFNVDEATPEGS